MCGLHMHHKGMTHFFPYFLRPSESLLCSSEVPALFHCVCVVQHVPASDVEGMGTDSSIYRSICTLRLRPAGTGLCLWSILTSVTVAILSSPAAEEGVRYCISIKSTDLCVFLSVGTRMCISPANWGHFRSLSMSTGPDSGSSRSDGLDLNPTAAKLLEGLAPPCTSPPGPTSTLDPSVALADGCWLPAAPSEMQHLTCEHNHHGKQTWCIHS